MNNQQKILEFSDNFIRLENGLKVYLNQQSVEMLQRPRYFCLINTKKAQNYTLKAISSFSRNTPFRDSIDKFFLIDNDSSFDIETWGMIVIKNDTPKNFAENINQILELAIRDKADFILMSNDIIFTQNWLQPLINYESIILPLSNQNITEQTEKFKTKFVMSLEDYIGNEDELEIIAKKITQKDLKFKQPKLIPYFCFYLPYVISSVVGLFDENFGRGGGEDVDYRLRAAEKGFQTIMSPHSFVLHFMGVSTWRSGETEQSTEMHNKKYRDYFVSKWGQQLADELLNTELDSFLIKPE